MCDKLKMIHASEHQKAIFDLFTEHFSRDMMLNVTKDTSNFMQWRYGKGEQMSLDELYCMISVMLTMCVHSTRDIKDHWSANPMLLNPFIKETMSREQFLQLWYNLRFCDTKSTVQPPQEELPDNDEDGDHSTKYEEYLSYSTKYEKEKNIVPTLTRVKIFSKKIQDQWQYAYAKYIPTNNKFRYTIDESLLFFNGRVLFKVFNPMKPARFGIDFKVIAQTDFGYVIGFEMYCGKQEGSEYKTDKNGTMTDKLVFRLLSKVMDHVQWERKDKQMVLYLYNGYTSARLAQQLASSGIRVCGTIQSTRMGLSRDEKTQLNDMQKKDFQVVREVPRKMLKETPDVNVVIYQRDKDTKPVRFVYTTPEKSDDVDQAALIKVNNSHGREIERTVVAEEYNHSYFTIDKFDQSLSYVRFIHKTKKWSNRVFVFLLQTAIYNSFVVFKIQHPEVDCGIKDIYIWLAFELRNQAKIHRIKMLIKKGEYSEPKIKKIIRAHSVAPITAKKVTKGKCCLCFKNGVSCYCNSCKAFYCQQCKYDHIADCIRMHLE
ncbi:Transposase_IS4 [Hexamita inflata]|uniref:Transposase IS4 n=1 Tax=Hexamita inflata TaxID=28002 RepID=A0AA86Q8S2_9EUKA|nr:Transposase IS4 [Hexamita inflata]